MIGTVAPGWSLSAGLSLRLALAMVRNSCAVKDALCAEVGRTQRDE